MGVRVRYSDGSERWCESCIDPNDNGGGSVVQGGTEHRQGGGARMADTSQGTTPQTGTGPGGRGYAGTQAAGATAQDQKDYPSFYPGQTGYNANLTHGQNATTSTTPPGNPSNPAAPSYAGSNQANAAASANPNGTPKTAQEWSFDPTMPSRAISAGMSLLGLPSYGPAADFYTRYGQAGISQSLADGDFMNPGSFQNAMTNRLQGINPSMGAGDMIRSLMGGESLGNALGSGADSQLSKYFDKDATGKWTPKAGMNAPEDITRAAYIANNESDPSGMSTLLTGALTGNGINMSSSLSNLLGAFLGNIATRRFNASGPPQNDTMQYLGKLLGF